MNDDLVGIGGLLGCIVLLVLYALAIGAKTKQQPSKPLKPIQPPTRNIKTPKTNVTSLAFYKARQSLKEYYAKYPPLHDLISQRGKQTLILVANTENGGTTGNNWSVRISVRLIQRSSGKDASEVVTFSIFRCQREVNDGSS